MRTTNKLKIIIIVILFYIAIMLTSIAGFAQGGPPNGMGGPPNPPSGYCVQNPGDPACNGNTSIPVGSDEATFGLLLCAIGLGCYMLNKKKSSDGVI